MRIEPTIITVPANQAKGAFVCTAFGTTALKSLVAPTSLRKEQFFMPKNNDKSHANCKKIWTV